MRLFIIAAVLSLILPPFHAFSQTISPTPSPFPLVSNDFDGDGLSDIVLYSNQNDGSPNEYVYSFDYSSDSQTLPSSIEFGSSGDIIVPGRYEGELSDLAVVKSDGESLNWLVRSTEEGEVVSEISFGVPGI